MWRHLVSLWKPSWGKRGKRGGETVAKKEENEKKNVGWLVDYERNLSVSSDLVFPSCTDRRAGV